MPPSATGHRVAAIREDCLRTSRAEGRATACARKSRFDPESHRFGVRSRLVSRPKHQRGWAAVVIASGLCGVTAVVVMIGLIVGRLTTSSKQPSMAIVSSIALVAALLGGYVVAPYLNRLAKPQKDELSSRR